MVVLITYKNEEDLIKTEGARAFTTLYINFLDAQGQITPESVVRSGRNLIQSNMKGLECSQHFSHYKSMAIFPDDQGQLTPPSLV